MERGSPNKGLFLISDAAWLGAWALRLMTMFETW